MSRRQICKLSANVTLDPSLPRFGPLYGTDESLIRTGKEEAWQHILKKSLPRSREAITTEFYLSEIRQVEKEARQAYSDDESVGKLTGTEFRWMMIKDGCFFLQLALILLGCEDLGYSPDHVIFGKNAKIKDWIRSFFFVGNQIPFVVLKKLMKQSFFQEVIVGLKQKRPSDLSRAVIYDFLVLPALEERFKGPCTPLRRIFSCTRPRLEALDLLHAVQLLVVGPEEASKDSDEYDREEEESLESEDEDLERGSRLLTTNAQRSHQDDEKRFPRATELRQAGVHFLVTRGKGSKGIYFKNYFFIAFLHLPRFPFDEHTMMVFQSLKRYEMNQPVCRNKLEVQSYLRLMSELITTTEDAKRLASKGIVQKGRKYHEKLPKMLKKLSAKEEYNQSYRNLSFKIGDYSRPSWVRLTQILSLFSIVISILTVAQTIFTILPYYKKGPGQ